MMERKCLVFSFADVEVREREFSIARDGEVLAVEPKAFRVLLFLLRSPHKLITKEELLDAVWGDVAVSENSLTRSIALLRKLLGDDTHEPRYIATIPTVGYRFLCDVKVSEDGFIGTVDGQERLPAVEANIPAKSEEKQPTDRRWRLSPLLVAGLCVLAVGILAAISLLHRAAGRRAVPQHRITEQRITFNSSEAPIQRAVVSRDGKLVAYADPTGLYLRVIATGETRRWDLPKDFIAVPLSWFPDGTHLLAARTDGPTRSIWKLSLFGAAPRKLIDNAVRGAVSPDGTRIAFTTFPTTSGNQLWVMGADGSNPHKIAEASPPQAPTHSGSTIFSPAWSLNGRRIACIEHYWPAEWFLLTDLSSVWTRDADGGDLQVVLRNALLGRALSWAPDGRILFSSHTNTTAERADEEVHSIRVDEQTGKATGQPELVTSGVGTIGGITVTSDGKRMALWRDNTQEQVFISEFDASTHKWKTPRRLTLDANGNSATAWLSDSRTVVFASNRNGTWALFKQAIDETTADVLVEGHNIYLPRLSADGSQVLYLSKTDPADPSVPISLMRLPVAGGPPQLVLRDTGLENYQCARLPSTLCIGSKLEKNGIVLFSFDPVSGISRELTKLTGTANVPIHNWSLSPDGRTFADFFPPGHGIRFLSIENGAVKEVGTVTLHEWTVYNGDWNADGSALLVSSVTPSGTPVILEVNKAGKASVVLEGAAGTPFFFMIQSPDGHHGILEALVPGDNNAWMVDNF
jgi:DNA-binding winged helix-turn-helix (wHTH) protein/Tol biopolymer transport system component